MTHSDPRALSMTSFSRSSAEIRGWFLRGILMLVALLFSTVPAWSGPPLPPPPSSGVTGQDRHDLERAARALQAGDFETALEILDKILVYDPGRGAALLLRASALRSLGRHADALAAAQAAVRRNGSNALGQRIVANIFIDEGRSEDAEKAARRAVLLDPAEALNYNTLGLAVRARALTPLPYGEPITDAQGDILLQRGGLLNEAARLFETATQMNPTLADAFINLGATLADLGRTALATRALENSLRLDPANPSAHIILGVTHFRGNDLVGAVREFEEALRIDPNNPCALVNLAAVRYQQGLTDEALSLAQKALEREAANPQALVLRGTIRRDVGHTDAARKDLDLAVNVAPNDGAAHAALGTLLLHLGEAESAQAELEKAVNLGAADAAVENNLGLVYKLLARYDRARVHFEKALEITPDSPDIHYNLAVMLGMAGDHAGARENFKTYLRLRPLAPDADEVRERVKELQYY